MKIFITSGGTKVKIDDVRYIGNMSTGRYPAQLAAELLRDENIEVHFLMAKDSKTPHAHFYDYDSEVFSIPNLTIYEYSDYFEYKEKVVDLINQVKPDIIISAAAVSDYILDKTEGKISSDQDELVIRLKKAEKILPSFRALAPDAIIVGFKLLVNPSFEEITNAITKQLEYVDMCIFNDLGEIKQGMTLRKIFTKYESYNKTVKNAKELAESILNYKKRSDHYKKKAAQ